jgi:hypothetical protein
MLDIPRWRGARCTLEEGRQGLADRRSGDRPGLERSARTEPALELAVPRLGKAAARSSLRLRDARRDPRVAERDTQSRHERLCPAPACDRRPSGTPSTAEVPHSGRIVIGHACRVITLESPAFRTATDRVPPAAERGAGGSDTPEARFPLAHEHRRAWPPLRWPNPRSVSDAVATGAGSGPIWRQIIGAGLGGRLGGRLGTVRWRDPRPPREEVRASPVGTPSGLRKRGRGVYSAGISAWIASRLTPWARRQRRATTYSTAAIPYRTARNTIEFEFPTPMP